MVKTAEEALSGSFQIEFASANDSVKISSFHFVQQFLMEMAQIGALIKLFSCTLERWN